MSDGITSDTPKGSIVQIDGKTLTLAVALLTGGALGSGAYSATNDKLPTEVVKQVELISQTLGRMNENLIRLDESAKNRDATTNENTAKLQTLDARVKALEIESASRHTR